MILNTAFASLLAILASPSVNAFPGLNPGGLKRGGVRVSGPLKERAAEPYSPLYPYTGAQLNDLPGLGIGNKQVPAPGDTAHQFQPPPAGSVRGPCPGLNTAANHGFLSRDGHTTRTELTAMMQNVYNLDYLFALIFDAVGLATDGDPVAGTLSIGAGGLNTHNTFEGDTSLTRSDYDISTNYGLASGDDFSFVGALFKEMTDTVAQTSSTSAPLYDFTGFKNYKGLRYDESRQDNPYFYFGPKQFLLYAAACLVFKAFPSQSDGLQPNYATISSIFGAQKNAAGGYDFVYEKLPPNWRNRLLPLSFQETFTCAFNMYKENPRPFGASSNGTFVPNTDFQNRVDAVTTTSGILCLFYDILTDNTPGSVPLPTNALKYLLGVLNPLFGPFGCALLNIPA